MWLRKRSNTDTAEDIAIKKRISIRVAKLLRVPSAVIEESEDMQVVFYESKPPGHYRAHHDSGMVEDGLEPFRVYTVFFHINTPAKGGETQFPAAFKDTTGFTEQDWEDLEWGTQVNHTCDKPNAGLVLPAKRGQAVVWLNHRVSKEGLVEPPLQKSSMHCGCDVLEGEKMVANQWVWGDVMDQVCRLGPTKQESLKSLGVVGGGSVPTFFEKGIKGQEEEDL